MISAYLSEFDSLTPTQRSLVTHWIIDDPDRLPPSSLEEQDCWDWKNEEQGR